MAYGSQRGPRCFNSWRPSDGPLEQKAMDFRQQRSPAPLERTAPPSSTYVPKSRSRRYAESDQRLVPMSTEAMSESSAQAFRNPNLMPTVPRHSCRELSVSPTGDFRQDEKADEERLPQIWHTSIDELIRRTSHDYDLIMNYQRDAEGGQRWLPGDIAQIRGVGETLHRNIFSLRRWQRIVAQKGDRDKAMMKQIKAEVNSVKLQCERVQQAIVKYEQKCGFELLRDGVYAQDEDGNFYKPSTPRRYVADGGHLQDVLQLSTESMGDSDWSPPQADGRDYGGAARIEARTYNEPSSPPERGVAFDVASNNRFKRETTHEETKGGRQPNASRSSRVSNDRISKHDQGSSHGHKHHSLSPARADRFPDSVYSGLSAGDAKCRGRGKNNYSARKGASRRQAKRDRARDHSPRPTIGRLGKYKLHY